ncbi:MAG: hypothetical protein GWN71_11185, partial [Gammaproteobacteria bacterium]|nr:hypothetical protein [Gemmatimonadota bacterium]NIU74120.1 hypothetical protein [Gammaproteobacteria bacterium]
MDELHPFRISRLGDLDVDEGAAADFLQAIQEGLERRGRAPIVRLEVSRDMSPRMLERLKREFRTEGADELPLQDADIYQVDSFVDLGALDELCDLDLPETDYPPFEQNDPL